MTNDRDAHLKGILRLIDPGEKERAARQLASTTGRQKWLRKLRHGDWVLPKYKIEFPKGSRSDAAMLAAMRAAGAGPTCYVIASDSGLDDSFQPLAEMIIGGHKFFGHGTILSSIPGKLAFFRTAWPHQHFIVHRAD